MQLTTIQKRRIAVIAGGALLLAVATEAPRADIRIQTHEVGDAAPAKLQAAVDLGVFAFSILITWTRHIAR